MTGRGAAIGGGGGRSAILDVLEQIALRDGQVVHVESLAAREAAFRDPELPLPEALREGLLRLGVERLYTHQAQTLDAVRQGRHVVVVTGTASGKTLCYNLPVLEGVLADTGSRALYLFPTKALAQDQLKSLKRLAGEPPERAGRGRRRAPGRGGAAGVTGNVMADVTAGAASLPAGAASAGEGDGELGGFFRAGTYDGDTPASLRARLREQANILLTNPDMLHSGILPHHARWAGFFHRLRFVVIDEIHVYRGIFGSHVANVLRRLRRVCRHHGADPIFICASATIANPRELAEKLVGAPFEVVDTDGAPRGRKHFVFWNPPRMGEAGMERRSSNLEGEHIMLRLLQEGYQAIAFVRTRAMTEVLLRYLQEDLRRDGGGLASRVRAYRAGYLPEERRKIEAALFNGELLGVISTNALELGIDVGSLDAAILIGYPGTIASTWQQAGRAGRRSEDAVAVLLAHNSPIDQYLMANPDYFFGRNPEQAILDPGNPHILVNHLRCAAFEVPIPVEEEASFGEYAPALLDLLQDQQHLQPVRGRWFYTRGDYPSSGVSLRNAGENIYTIIETPPGRAAGGGTVASASSPAGSTGSPPGAAGGQARENRVIGTIDESSAFTQVHPQAVYMHEGETYFVDLFDLSEKAVYIHKADLDYYTQAISDIYIDARQADAQKTWRGAEVSFGECSVHDKVTMFKKIKFGSRDSLGYGTVSLPHVSLHTTALWLVPPKRAVDEAMRLARVPADGLQGIANVMGDVISLLAMCDPLDLGTVVEMRNVGGPTIHVYDKYPGGLGYAQRAFHQIEEVMQAALTLIRGCACEDGCPSCVGSPIIPLLQMDPDALLKGRIPDKEAALVMLHAMLELEPYIPRRPLEGDRELRARLLLEREKGRASLPRERGFADADEDTGAPGEGGGRISGRVSGADARSRERGVAPPGTAKREPAVPRGPVKPLPPDLKRKIEGQIARLSDPSVPRRKA